jgi:Fur family ferric uptake transcriptional regulator
MKTLDQFDTQTVMILDISASAEEKKYLNGIGIFPEILVTIIKNKKQSPQPLLVEISDSRFMIGREVAKKISAVEVLENQEVIFKGNKTQQREIILEVLKEFSMHFSLKECVEAVQKKDNHIGEITVYRTIKTLKEKNILEEIELPDGTKKFEICKGHHDHIFCQNCGNIIEFYSEEIENLQKKIAKEHGISLISHQMTLVGSNCKKCRK